MKTKEEITGNWLERYTRHRLDEFTPYVLLTNFNHYVDLFCEAMSIPQVGYEANMRTAIASDAGMTIINFGIGSPNAALIMDLLGAVSPRACLFWANAVAFRTKPDWEITYCHWQEFVAKVRVMIIFLPKYRHCRRLCCSVPYLQLCVMRSMIIGRERYIPPIAGFGNMTKSLKPI